MFEIIIINNVNVFYTCVLCMFTLSQSCTCVHGGGGEALMPIFGMWTMGYLMLVGLGYLMLASIYRVYMWVEGVGISLVGFGIVSFRVFFC